MGVRWLDIALLAYARTFEHPMKLRLVRWLIRRLAAGRLRVRYTPGAIVAIDPADYIGWAIVRAGNYEAASLGLALRIMEQDAGLFIDVGANFGWYSCAVAAIAGSRVIAVEPDCENCAMLRANIALNRRQNIDVVNVAVGSAFEAVQIIRRAGGNSGTVAVRSGQELPNAPGTWVATFPLAALLERIVDPPARPVLIKIDVEGFEPHVLAGLDFAGPFRPKHLIVEFARELADAAWGSFAAFEGFFAEKGYELLDVHGRNVHDASILPEQNIWAREKPT